MWNSIWTDVVPETRKKTTDSWNETLNTIRACVGEWVFIWDCKRYHKRSTLPISYTHTVNGLSISIYSFFYVLTNNEFNVAFQWWRREKKHETEISRMKRRHFSFHLSFSLVTLEVSFSLCTKYGNTTESSSARRSISVKHSSRFFFFLSFTRVCTLNRHI